MLFYKFLLFVPTSFALNLMPGPNNILSATIGAQYGHRPALVAASGRIAAFSIMIALSALGMGALLAASAMAFAAAKLVGAAYLLCLGIRTFTSGMNPGLRQADHEPPGARGFMRKEFLVAIGNPKAILIFTAFFPQFVTPGDYWWSYVVLGTLFLLLELVAVGLYAQAGRRITGMTRRPGSIRWINRISGAAMFGFGILLLTAKRPTM